MKKKKTMIILAAIAAVVIVAIVVISQSSNWSTLSYEAVVQESCEEREVGINADMAKSIPDILKTMNL